MRLLTRLEADWQTGMRSSDDRKHPGFRKPHPGRYTGTF